ncbi:MAG TPA: hypothetical protein VMT34_01750 [Aggregatilineales bacterium]|nr:hypothetical protein [Aggregatilineales bacterium]
MPLDVIGLSETVAALEALRDALPGVLAAEMEAAISPLFAAITTYPAPLPHSRYRRTGYYGASASTGVEGYGLEATGYVTTPAPYAVFVRGDLVTGYPGRDGWESLQSIVDRLLPGAIDRLQSSVDRLTEGG